MGMRASVPPVEKRQTFLEADGDVVASIFILLREQCLPVTDWWDISPTLFRHRHSLPCKFNLVSGGPNPGTGIAMRLQGVKWREALDVSIEYG